LRIGLLFYNFASSKVLQDYKNITSRFFIALWAVSQFLQFGHEATTTFKMTLTKDAIILITMKSKSLIIQLALSLLLMTVKFVSSNGSILMKSARLYASLNIR